MLRPSLCIATARDFGASPADAVRSAVALELLHNAFLVHDDIEDESDTRRGRPTLHSLHGVAAALNVGVDGGAPGGPHAGMNTARECVGGRRRVDGCLWCEDGHWGGGVE